MTAYIIRRLLLLIPTLLGIFTINFIVVQFAPGGPVEMVIQQYVNPMAASSDTMSRLGGKTAGGVSSAGSESTSKYRGSENLDPAFIKEIEKMFGFDKPWYIRYFTMLWDFFRFDFGKDYYRNEPVISLIAEKMPVSITLGAWSLVLTLFISVPLGIAKAYRDGSRFDIWTSSVISVFYAIPAFLFAVLLIILFAGGSYLNIFPIRGLVSDNWEELNLGMKIVDYLWHITLPVICNTIGGFAMMTLMTKNFFINEIHMLYVTTARSKGLTEKRIRYGHVFRNAMLILLAGIPGMIISLFLGSNMMIEIIFNLDGLGLLGFQAILQRNYPIFFANLYIMTLLGLILRIVSDISLTIIDPRIDFETREV